MTGEGDLGGRLVHLDAHDVGQGAVAAVDDALIKRAGDFGEGHGLTADAAFLGEVDVQGDVGHAHAQVLHVVDGLDRLLGVEVTEAEGEGVQHAHAGLFGEALRDQIERLAAVHGATGVRVVVEQHGRFEHGHRRLDGGRLGAGGAHLDDALAGAGDVGVFLAELAVGEHLHFVFPAGEFLQDFTEFAHAEGFGFPVGFHTGHLDDDFVGREAGRRSHTEQKTAREKQGQCTFHFSPPCYGSNVNISPGSPFVGKKTLFRQDGTVSPPDLHT